MCWTDRDTQVQQQNDVAARILPWRRAGSNNRCQRFELRISALTVTAVCIGVSVAIWQCGRIVDVFLGELHVVIVVAEVATAQGELKAADTCKVDAPAVCNVESWERIQPISGF